MARKLLILHAVYAAMLAEEMRRLESLNEPSTLQILNAPPEEVPVFHKIERPKNSWGRKSKRDRRNKK